MLWADWERRKNDLLRMSIFFKKGNFVETSVRIKKIVRYFKMDKLDKPAFKEELGNLFNIFRREFTQKNNFEESFREIESIIASAFLEQKGEFYNKLLEIYPLIKRQRDPTNNFHTIQKVFLDLDEIKFERERFYGLCFLYLILVEGIFNEWMRILYALKNASEGINITLDDVYNKKLSKIKNEFKDWGVSDILFDGWEDNHIRNAIAHGHFRYDEKIKKMNFWDIDPKTGIESYKPRAFTFKEFAELGLKVEIISYISERLLFLLRIWDLIISTNPYNASKR